MKFLIDQNLSPKLVEMLSPEFPGSTHVRLIGLQTASDAALFHYAKEHGYTLLTKDDDFHFLSVLYGKPPRVVRVALGNCTTQEVWMTLAAHLEALRAFEHDDINSYLIVG